MKNAPEQQLIQILRDGKEKLLSLHEGEKVVQEGSSFGDPEKDIELAADKTLGHFFQEKICQIPTIGRVTVEGISEDAINSEGEFWVTVDPIDGSLNYKTRGQTTGFPYTCCVTVLGRYEGATFNDVQWAAVLDLRKGIEDFWLAVEKPPLNITKYLTTVNNLWAKRAQIDRFDLGSQIVIGEMYYPENREKLIRAFKGQKGWLRSPGSASYEMASVATGQAVAFVCDRQKQHELGAGYALVTGAGGVAVDWDGNDLGPRIYDFKTQTPVVLAANRRIADDILRLLSQS